MEVVCDLYKSEAIPKMNHGGLTLPFNVVAANNLTSVLASEDWRMPYVVDHASGCCVLDYHWLCRRREHTDFWKVSRYS